MRILYLNVIEQHAEWGAEWYLNQAFLRQGHATYCVDYRQHRHALAPQLRRAPRCDALLVQRGEAVPLAVLHAFRGPRFFWASELVSRRRDQDRLLRSGLFEHVFLRTPQCIDAVVERGWLDRRCCSVLLSAFDPTLHRPLADVERDVDVLFVGSMTARRRRLLAAIAGQFHVMVAHEFGERMVRLLNRAKIVLNFHAEDYLDTETRVFETLGSGAFLLTERLSLENPFRPGEELVEFDDIGDAADKLRHYLAHEDERSAIAQAGLRTALAGHTYDHRARQVFDIMAPWIGGGPYGFDGRLRAYGVVERMCAPGVWMARRLWAVARRLRRVVAPKQ